MGTSYLGIPYDMRTPGGFLVDCLFNRTSPKIREREGVVIMSEVLTLEGLVTYPKECCLEDSWHAKAVNFKDGRDFSHYKTLKIRVKGKVGGERIKIQLINDLQKVNSPEGLLEETFELSRDFEVIEISLLRFKELGVDLTNIYRLAIHCGREIWGERLNDTNANEIIIERIELVGNHEC